MKRKIDLDSRLIAFAVLVTELAESLPDDFHSKYICMQLIRSGNSCALNYGEVMGAESASDFIHKMKVVLKELRESFVSIQIINNRKICSDQHLLDRCLKECDELIAIIITSINTAVTSRKKRKNI